MYKKVDKFFASIPTWFLVLVAAILLAIAVLITVQPASAQGLGTCRTTYIQYRDARGRLITEKKTICTGYMQPRMIHRRYLR